jgi:hypothetical protein
MTGSIHQLSRQHSSTTANTTMEKIYRPKLRRCSSADDHNSKELTPDINQQISVFKRESITSDVDSGTEEIEQQLEHAFVATSFDHDDQVSIKSFGPNFDEGFSECEESQVQIQNDDSKLPRVEQDRKLHHTLFFCFVIMTQQKFVMSQY